MEIALDIPFIQRTLKEEYDRARAEIQSAGVVDALQLSHARHDARIAAAPDIGTLACRAGCSWCCYFSIEIRAVEAFNILGFVERTFSSEQKARAYAEIRANSDALKELDEDQRARRNVKCPFLAEGRCSIYTARPQSCRNYHATDVTGCKQSYEDPDNMDIDPDFAPWVYQAGNAHVDAFSTALRDAGYDVGVYELNTVLAAALAEPSARERFEARLPPFAELEGEDVPPEFDDLDD